MIGAMTPLWPKAAQVFHERATEYDGWFNDSLIFDIELAALQDLRTVFFEPRIELGVGPGRFAAELGVKLGIDPAHGALTIARERVPLVCQGVGEQLPLRSDSVGIAFLLFTLCFTMDPGRVIAELGRILKPKGHLVLGLVPRNSPWGVSLRKKRQEGHAFYQHSHFYEPSQVVLWFKEAGLTLVEERSSLFQAPGEVVALEQSKPGNHAGAGFMILVGQKN